MKKTTKPCIAVFMFFCMLLSVSAAVAGSTKLHISTNKEKYNNAETIQFQILMTNPSAKINNTLFVELLDCNGNRLDKQMLPFDLNISSGHFVLPAASKGEFYLLYCYVNNSDSVESSSVKKIFIKNNGLPQQKSTGSKINVSSFFEGGTFVAESPNNILVQCTDENSNPVKARGKITNGKTNIYAVFETNELGFAKVTLNPEDKVRYYIEVKDLNNNEGKGIVPVAASSGITLNTTINEGSIIYNAISYTSPNDNIPDYRIEAIWNDTIVYEAAVSFQNGLSAVKEELKREAFPAGFITFRIVDRSNKIYAQRVTYNASILPQTNFIRVIDTINKREAKIDLPDMISGRASIQVKTADADLSLKNDLNFLELTDRISVNDQLIASANEPVAFNAADKKANRYLSLSGILQNSEKKPLKNKTVNIILVHKNFKKQYLVTKTNQEGKLQIDNLVFFDTATVYYQLADKSEEKNNVFLDIKVSPSKEYTHSSIPPLNLLCGADLKATDSSMIKDEKVLKQVTVTSEKEKTDSEKYADKYISGQMKKSQALRNEFDFIKNPEAVDNKSLFLFIQSRIPSLRIFTNFMGDVQIVGTNGGTVGVYLNDMELPINESLDIIRDLQVKDVALLKYYTMGFKPKALGNPLTDSKASDAGDLLIYTKRDFNASEDKTKGLPKATVVGYTLERKDDLASVSTGINEPLFWKADWSVESGQRIFVNTPAGDVKKDMEIIIEGVNTFSAPYRFTQKLVFK